jgi:hypothetical protein
MARDCVHARRAPRTFPACVLARWVDTSKFYHLALAVSSWPHERVRAPQRNEAAFAYGGMVDEFGSSSFNE